MFIEQGIKSENKFWKYILGSILIIITSFLGQAPLLVALYYDTLVKGKPYPTSNDDIMRFFEPNLTLFLILISFVFVMLGIFFVVRYLHNQTMLSITTARAKIDWKRVLFSFSIWAIFTILSTLAFY